MVGWFIAPKEHLRRYEPVAQHRARAAASGRADGGVGEGVTEARGRDCHEKNSP